ncbi:MAG: hypothetical protein MUE40_10665 [Anaerolineae bacterium]|nr:hypothetical protein [Anaerolineae bacterium]
MTTGSLHVNRDIILATKRHYLNERKHSTPLEAVLALAQMRQRPRNILNTMQDDGRITLIGQLTRTEIYDPVSTALTYVQEGVDALAFFTDHSIYPGDLDDMLLVARGLKDTPVIYQNYVIDEYSVISARAADASAVILYSSLLEAAMLRRVVGATQRWKMTALLQVEDESALATIRALSPHVVAYGDDLSGTFERSFNELRRLRPEIPPHTRVMFMHSLQTLDEVEAALSLRVHAIIVGDALLRQEKKAARLRQLIQHPLSG